MPNDRPATNHRTPPICADCGARPETPTTGDGRALCSTCAHIHRLRTRQQAAAENSRAAATEAATLLADELTRRPRPLSPPTFGWASG
ncbi:hypothetical protein ABTZ03_40860 [Kitasatospora sp. NPDC096077]|uniref:hypothetical protein n=1 Tax=Kitasatospora sp. NPDC096077 TaxID=3155544 RepID=UPI003317079D